MSACPNWLKIFLPSKRTCCRNVAITNSIFDLRNDPYFAGSIRYYHSFNGFMMIFPEELHPSPYPVMLNHLLVNERLKPEGLSSLGHGAYSDVYALDEERVVKYLYHYDQRSWVRDRVLLNVVDELASGARLNGKRFIRIAKDFSTPDQLAQGIRIQERIHGYSAFKHAEQHTEELIEELGALEQFYRTVHQNVMNFHHQNGLAFALNEYDRDLDVRVGLDFNHGLNVIWSDAEKMWVIIDW